MTTVFARALLAPSQSRRAGVLAGSVILHGAVLALASANLVMDRSAPPQIHDRPIFLDIQPRPLFRGEMTRPAVSPVASPLEAPTRPTGRGAIGEEVRETPRIPAPPSAAPPEIVASTGSGSGSGRPLPTAPAWREDVCRDLSNFAAWEAADCRTRGPTPAQALGSDEAARTAAAEERVGRRSGSASERRRDEGFARQAAANEAWRAYVRDEGPYPGLRSLFTEH